MIQAVKGQQISISIRKHIVDMIIDKDVTITCQNVITCVITQCIRLRPDFKSKLVHVLAFRIPNFYIAPYDKIQYELVNLSSNCNVKSGLTVIHLKHFHLINTCSHPVILSFASSWKKSYSAVKKS